ncbi:sialic acid-binding Ig-like lectin 5 [Dasypus novemcinctus]|uniref:sialic acid-binding Ig-like lectin 5 n=1 Tax=Dasypus novemcinctus TaxID=9361 RepID=UPI0039C8E701
MLALLLLPLLWAEPPPQIQLHVQESVSLQEGQCALVPCSFSFPGTPWSGPLHVSWFWDKDNTYYDLPVATNKPDQLVKAETRGRFLLQDSSANTCSLQVRHARRSDAGTYRLRVEGKWKERLKQSDKRLDLWVTALTEKPDIHFWELLASGHPTNLTCSLPGSCEGDSSPTFFWTGAALDPLDPQTHYSPVLTLTPRLQDHGTNLTCWVRPQGAQGATERTLQLQVSYSPQNLTISICGNDTALKSQRNGSSLSILEGQALHLFCEADGNPPAQLSWFRGSPAPNASCISNSSHLELPPVRVEDGGELTCRAENALGSALVSLNLSVLYPPQLLGPSCSWEADGLRCSCSARAHPAPSLRWRLGEGNSSDAYFTATAEGPWASSNLSLRGELNSDLRLSCEARNALGAQSIAVVLLPGQGPVPGTRLGWRGGCWRGRRAPSRGWGAFGSKFLRETRA